LAPHGSKKVTASGKNAYFRAKSSFVPFGFCTNVHHFGHFKVQSALFAGNRLFTGNFPARWNLSVGLLNAFPAMVLQNRDTRRQ
jgi:hypothetical protein